jgi:ribosomal-protein-alanine N-acetyltransferase
MSSGGEVSQSASGATVRRLTTADVPSVSEILAESPGAAGWSKESLLRSASEEFPAWVAEQAEHVVGLLIGRIAGDEFEILNVAVARRFRRQGIASRLLDSALEFSRVAGSPHVYLEVRASNEAAIALYSRHGFTKCGLRTKYYRSPEEDALLFSRHNAGTL